MKIDAHHHFWHYNTQDYGWISDEMAVLRRDFLPADLKPELDRAGIDRVVSVQARQCIEETEFGEGTGNPLQYSCLENSMDRGASWATAHGVTESWP